MLRFFKLVSPVVLVSFGCCNKLLQTEWLKTSEIYSFTLLEVRSLKSRYQQGADKFVHSGSGDWCKSLTLLAEAFRESWSLLMEGSLGDVLCTGQPRTLLKLFCQAGRGRPVWVEKGSVHFSHSSPCVPTFLTWSLGISIEGETHIVLSILNLFLQVYPGRYMKRSSSEYGLRSPGLC